MSYRTRHNEANGEDDRDGIDVNDSENYDTERETTDAGINAVRKRQIKNFLLIPPILRGGDELRRTQGGNNNVMFNASADTVEFALLPAPPHARSHLAVDTAGETSLELHATGEKLHCHNSQTYRLSPRSSSILLARYTIRQRWPTVLTAQE